MSTLGEANAFTGVFAAGGGALVAQQRLARQAEWRREAERRERERTPRRTEAELQRIAAQGRDLLHGSQIGAQDEADAARVLAWVIDTFGDRIAVASSMADTVLVHLVSSYKPWVDVLFGDTGYHFETTLATRDRVAADMRVNVVSVRPRASVAEQDLAHGKDLFASDPTKCCHLRKVVPMRDQLADYEVWLTGVRRADAPSRAQAPIVVWDQANKLVKVNPIAAWSDEQTERYIAENAVIVNPLLSQGYPSIGCAPCTSMVEPGADPRSGRWAGQTKTECGLHVI
ncbi:phosphoadenylyl-sulfate reductase [Rarobacter incanus]|uniref:Adenosine 5'-phosphosulfate reductase n=1 Tax=Rarobacter incanus TaxID=153494 RepID=A0A542SR97_9MICO|nr:phosphoadenylyl-sulfate reductase [Rarobacter incanus]TQK77132.1 phosphoadenylylsulfate reductase (thioredoxin) [Rarobacter incanus]